MRNNNMSAAARQITATLPTSNGTRPAVVTEMPITAQPKSRLKRLWAILSHGDLKVIPMTAQREHNEYAQRWPAPAIAAILLTGLMGLGGIMVSVGIAAVTLYSNSSGISRAERDADIINRTELKGRIEAVEKENHTLKDRQDQVEKLVGLKVIEPKQ